MNKLNIELLDIIIKYSNENVYKLKPNAETKFIVDKLAKNPNAIKLISDIWDNIDKTGFFIDDLAKNTNAIDLIRDKWDDIMTNG
jgi:hypothetical protein